tara:strand:+ start:185 stop:670 length:486 start_codon:yes stop_codon:yes gene_type:complete
MRINLQSQVDWAEKPADEPVHFKVSLARHAVAKALENVNGRAVAHVASAQDVFDQARDAEAHLDVLGIPKTDRKGARRDYVSGAPVTAAYARKASWRAATRVILQRGSRDWFVVSVERAYVGERGGAGGVTCLTAAQERNATDRFHAQFDVIAHQAQEAAA